MSNAVYVAQVMQANRLSDVMVRALLTATLSGDPVQGDERSVNALKHISRRLIDADSNALTERGQIVWRALSGDDLTEEEKSMIFPAPADRYFVDGLDILPFSEATNGDVPLSLGDAKSAVIAKLRDSYREQVKEVRALRKADVVGPPTPVDEDSEIS